MSDTKWDVIGRGLKGWHAISSNGSYSGGTLEEYIKDAKEGAYIYDATEAYSEDFIKFVINGPICDPELPPGSNEQFRTDLLDSAKRMLPMMGGIWKSYLTKAINNPNYRGLDRVSPDVYIGLLKSILGMKVGHIIGGEIIWD